MGLPLFQVAHGAVSSLTSSASRSAEVIRSLLASVIGSLDFSRASKTPLIARRSSTPIEGSKVSATASIAFAAFQAAVFQSPPPASAIAKRGTQLARRRLWKPGGISGVALANAAALSAVQRISCDRRR